MVLFGKAMVCSNRLLQNVVVFGTVWSQFAIQFLTGGCEHRGLGKRVVVRGWRWVPWVAWWWLPIPIGSP